MKRVLSLLLTAALMLSLLTVCVNAADTQDTCTLARQHATRVSNAVTPKKATRGNYDNIAIPSIDMDGQSFLIGSTAELELGLYGQARYQSFKVEIYKGSNINTIGESDFITGWTGGIPDGVSTQSLRWDTTGQAAGDYLFVTMIYDSYDGIYLSDSFYYAQFSLVKNAIALKSISLRDADTDAALTGWKTLQMDDSLSFYTVFNPNNATGSRVKTITSGNPDVVKIQNFGGIFTAVPQLPGKTTITVTVNGKSAYFGIEVPGSITLKLSRNYQSLTIGSRYYLTAFVSPESVTKYASLNWKSDTPSVATVDFNGMVTAISPGMATITCSMTYNGVTYSDKCRFSVPAEDDPCRYYEDVVRSEWYHDSVDFALESGLMGSTDPMRYIFEPNTKLTRAMVVSILYRIAGSPEAPARSGIFTDVKEGKWYADPVEWCAANGLASGKGDGRFDPNGNVTRQELAAFMYRLAEYLEQDTEDSADLSGFVDAEAVSAWAVENVRWAVGAGLISGRVSGGETMLAPQGTATRAEFASIIMRFVQKYAET